MTSQRVTIRAFNSINDTLTATNVNALHSKVIDYYGANYSTDNPGWIENPDTICICIIDEKTEQIIGANRIEIFQPVLKILIMPQSSE